MVLAEPLAEQSCLSGPAGLQGWCWSAARLPTVACCHCWRHRFICFFLICLEKEPGSDFWRCLLSPKTLECNKKPEIWRGFFTGWTNPAVMGRAITTTRLGKVLLFNPAWFCLAVWSIDFKIPEGLTRYYDKFVFPCIWKIILIRVTKFPL